MVEAVFSQTLPFHLLIVDDGSPDGTATIIQQLQLQYPERLFLVQRSGKLGLGTAYICGFNWGIERQYDYIYEMDADFSHNPNDLERLYNACAAGADVAVGSRYVKGGKLENWPGDRIILSKGASVYVRMITMMPVRDPTAGFVCYKKEVLESIDLEKIRFIGYAFQIEMKYAAYRQGYKITEVPITFMDRIEGYSKMNSSIISEAILGVIQMRWHALFNSYAKNVPSQAPVRSRES